ncbi:MAG: transcriptional regulator [Rubrivivax sp.]
MSRLTSPRNGAILWADDEREEFISYIAAEPEGGDVIPESGGCRKVRWKRQGMGKRGGARVIYFLRSDKRGDLTEVVLLIVYAKAKFDNIAAATLAKIKEKLDAHHKAQVRRR